MLQQFTRNAPPSHTDSSLSSAGISVPIQERLARHVIEDELQSNATRAIQKRFYFADSTKLDRLRNRSTFFVSWILVGFGLFLSGDSVSKWLSEDFFRVVFLFYYIGSFVLVGFSFFYLSEHLRKAPLYFRRLRQDHIDGKDIKKLRATRCSKQIQSTLLRHGVAVPALISHIEEENNFHRIEFVYRDTAEEYRSGTVTVYATEMAEHLLYTGKNFTLLQSPDNPQEVLPYFLVTDFEVRPAKDTGR